MSVFAIRTYLLVMLLALVPSGCAKPVVEGVVVHGVDETPLPGVTVRIEGTTLTAVADAEGRYAIGFVPGTFTVVAEAGGFFPASRSFTVAEKGRVPAAPLELYPDPGAVGVYAAVPGLGLRRIPEVALRHLQNLVETISGIRDVAEIPGLQPGWRLLVVGEAPAEYPLRPFAYASRMDMAAGFAGRRQVDVDMWVPGDAGKAEVRALVPGRLAEIVLPGSLSPGVYTLGGQPARRSTIEAAGTDSKAVAFIIDYEGGFGLPGKALDIPGEQGGWEDDFETFRDVLKLGAGETDPELWIQCTLLSCGASSCRRQCRIAAGPKREIVLPVYDEGGDMDTHFDPDTLTLTFSQRVWRSILEECQACPHHREKKVWRYDLQAGRMVAAGESVSVRHFDSRGMIPATWNGAIRLDTDPDAAGIRIGSEMPSAPDGPAVGSDGCVAIDGERDWLGEKVNEIRVCREGGIVDSIEVKGSAELRNALVRQYGLGQGGGENRWEGERVAMTFTPESNGGTVLMSRKRN